MTEPVIYRDPENPTVLAENNASAVLYGHSDDLIEIGGTVREEYDVWDVPSTRLTFNHGIIIDIAYDSVSPGNWTIMIVSGHEHVVLDELPTGYSGERYTDYLWFKDTLPSSLVVLNVEHASK